MAARNMYPVKKNNWSFRASIMPLTGEEFDPKKPPDPLRELPQELQKRSRVSICKSPPKKLAKDKRHIFQKIEDSKHQTAFKRFQYHTQKYEESKKLVMKKIDKVEEDILMENINLYRLRQENILIVEKSRSDEDKYYGDNTWEISLREHWTVQPGIGNLHSVPMPYDLLAQRTLERIGNPLKENMSLDYFTQTDSRADTRKSRWGPFEMYMDRLEKAIRTTVPHRPNFHGFQLVGQKIRPQTTDSERQRRGERIKFGKQEATPEAQYSEPALKVSTDSLFFSAKTGEIVHETVIMRNVGTVAIFFCWKKRPDDPLVEPPQAWIDANFQVPRRERFTVLESSGQIAPGQVKELRFNFMSNFAGSFFEKWDLWTSPVVPDAPAPIFLKGVATTEDVNGGHREKLVRNLQHREMVHGVEEVIEELLDTSSDLTSSTLKAKPDYLYTSAAYTFLRQNIGVDPPLYYNKLVDSQCQELVSKINTVLIQEAESRKPPVEDLPPPPPAAKKGGKGPPPPPTPPPEPEPEPVVTVQWDGSLSNLMRSTELITSLDSRDEMLKVFPKLPELAELPAHPSSTLHLAMYTVFNDSIHPVHDAIENTLADIAAKKKAEAEARLEARRKKAEEEGLDPDMVEEEEEAEQAPVEPQYDENGEEIPPPPPPKLYDCVPVASAVKDVLMQCFLRVEVEIEKLEDKAIGVVDSQIKAQKAKEQSEQTLWNIFALEREKLFLVLGKDRD